MTIGELLFAHQSLCLCDELSLSLTDFIVCSLFFPLSAFPSSSCLIVLTLDLIVLSQASTGADAVSSSLSPPLAAIPLDRPSTDGGVIPLLKEVESARHDDLKACSAGGVPAPKLIVSPP